jgi:hypothetical protein
MSTSKCSSAPTLIATSGINVITKIARLHYPGCIFRRMAASRREDENEMDSVIVVVMVIIIMCIWFNDGMISLSLIWPHLVQGQTDYMFSYYVRLKCACDERRKALYHCGATAGTGG